MFKPFAILVILAVLFSTPLAYGDDTTREVQEELRKRNLYFGDVDGRQTPGFIEAVKKYQERKGFAVTGQTDADTLRSLGLSSLEVVANAQLPDVPVLRSDRNMSGDRVAAAAPAISQPPRPDAPPPSRAEMIGWLRRYLEACQTPDTNDELGYYAEQVDYFHHGTVTRADIGRELAGYYQQWPVRRYWISGPVSVKQDDRNTIVRSRIRFELEGGMGRVAFGKVDNALTVARRPDLTWEIVAHEEERVRETARRTNGKKRRNSGPALTPLDRTLKKFFGPQPQPKRKRSRR